MSFWSNIAKYGLMAAPYVAAPFTGGSSLLATGLSAGIGAGQSLAAGGGPKDALMAGGIAAGTSLIPSTSIPGAATMNAAPNTTGMPNAMAAPVAPKPAQPSVWARMARNPETWQAAAQMIAGATEAASRNRSSLGDVQRASYVASGGQAYTPPAGTPTYGFGPQQTSGRLQERASDLEKELMGRLTPSFWERLGTFAAPAAGIYSTTLKK